MKSHLGAMVIATALVMFAEPSRATVVFDNGAPSHAGGFYGDAFNANGWVEAAAEIIVGPQGLRFDGMNWWGGYHPGDTLPTSEAFTLKVYSDPWRTQVLVAERSVGDLARNATGSTVFSNGVTEYAYRGTFSEIVLPEGHYAVGLSDADAGHSDNWVWEISGAVANPQAGVFYGEFSIHQGGYWGAAWFIHPYYLAFQATSSVPEIDAAGMGSVVALVGGAIGLLERRRVRGA